MLKLNEDKTVSYGEELIGALETLNNFGQGFNINLADGSFIYIPEEDCTSSEKQVFDAYHEHYKESGGIPKILEHVPDIEYLKTSKINLSKDMLTEYLKEHPLKWTDNKLYSVTFEKQTLLNNMITTYNIAKSAGKEYQLLWNVSGEENTVWSEADIVSLMLSISDYVAPYIKKQQEYEILIKTCINVDDINAVNMDYNI